MEIHVIRHTPVNFDKNRCYGRLDVPLADSFVQDAEALQKRLAKEYDYIVSSPKSRCTQLAQALAFLNVATDQRLLELNFGDWEGLYWNDINPKALQTWMDDFVHNAPTNGETLQQMFERVADFIDQLRQKEYDKILVITHAGVIRCFWAYFLEIPLHNIFKIPIQFGECFQFHLGKNTQYDAVKQLK